MTALKPGDRVHVEFDGEVWRSPDHADLVFLRLDGMGDPDFDATHGSYPSVYAEHCKVIVPPIKVGDVVTADNIEQLPSGSVVASPGIVAATKVFGKWRSPLELESMTDGNFLAWASDLRVLRIGGGES